MEILAEAKIIPIERLSNLMVEANELTSIFVTTAKSTRENMTLKAKT